MVNFDKVREIVEKSVTFQKGQRNEYIYNFASVSCKYGIEMSSTISELRKLRDSDQGKNEIEASVKSAYKKSKFGEYSSSNQDFDKFKKIENKQYKVPVWKNETSIPDRVVKWFEGRKISQKTLELMKVTCGKEWMPQIRKERENVIKFNYFRDGKLVNVKYRDAAKNFKLHSGAELILYNIDSIKNTKECYIVEGEIDCLTLIDVGISNVVSVPAGAKKGHDSLEYIDNCIDQIEHIEKFIIITDNDPSGEGLKNNLSKRLGIEKCYYIDLKGFNDPNEFLCKNKGIELSEICKKHIPFPVSGAYNVLDFENELDNIYYNGLNKGFTIGVAEYDEIISFEGGMFYVWSGIPSHGKSTNVDYVCAKLNQVHGLKTVYCSPENFPPQLHTSKLIEVFTGMKIGKKYMPEQVYFDAKTHINENFFFVFPDTEKEDFTIDTVLEKVKYFRFKYGIKVFVLDPYNMIEHKKKSSQSETEYISEFCDKMKRFALQQDIIVIVVAHPRKIQKNGDLHEVPTLYDINGSANWYNKPDFGVVTYRDMKTNIVSTIVQKCRWKHLGKNGEVEQSFDVNCNRYAPVNTPTMNDGTLDISNWLQAPIEQNDLNSIDISDFEIEPPPF